MDVFELENRRLDLHHEINNWNSNRVKLFLIYDYFQNILSLNDSSIFSAFATEFIDKYFYLLEKTDPYFVHPSFFNNIILQASEIKRKISDSEYSEKYSNIISHFENKFKKLNETLAGNNFNEIVPQIKFPVLEKSENKNIFLSGFLESLSIEIKKCNIKNRFIIIPSGVNLENLLETQINISWEFAVSYLKNYIKYISKFHEVIIHFDQKAGNYIGNSLGVVLAISFIEKLLALYIADYQISIKPGVTITGGIDQHQNLIAISNQIISQKTEIVFYSFENIFVVPKSDEEAAKKKLSELKTEFPKRNLFIESAENIYDIFNRRNLIEIKKLSYVKKTANKLKKNWKAAIIILPLLIFVAYFLYRDWDDNPANLEVTENTVFVKNKSGRVLWTNKVGFDPYRLPGENYLNYFQKLVDINNDGINEVILSHEEYSELGDKSNFRRIVCFDKNKTKIWQYSFKDTITTNLQKMDTIYSSFLIDTVTIKNKKSLVCVANNAKSYSSAIFQLDLKTGKRINSTLWNAGFFTNGLIFDFDKDGKNEIFANFVNNGYEQVGLLVIETEKLNGQCPTTSNYEYKFLPIADLEEYILFPKTDYTHYINRRIEGIPLGSSLLFSNENKFLINVEFGVNQVSIHYYYNYLLNNFEIIVGNGFRVMRDSLVVHGKLKPPLTDTDEYCNLLISQIKYWNGKEFVYRKDLYQ
ncbi:MAG: hypothetical protein IPH62_17205 [Ignavibacteriae bacterium]|nr:hypothetical protein [Ignavibacteriota bacterium]